MLDSVIMLPCMFGGCNIGFREIFQDTHSVLKTASVNSIVR